VEVLLGDLRVHVALFVLVLTELRVVTGEAPDLISAVVIAQVLHEDVARKRIQHWMNLGFRAVARVIHIVDHDLEILGVKGENV